MCREEFELIKHSLNNVEDIKDVMDNPVISFLNLLFFLFCRRSF